MTLLPPKEILAKRKALQQQVERGIKKIAELKKDVVLWNDELKALDTTLSTVYEYSVDSPPESQLSAALTTDETAVPEKRKRMTYEQYKEIVVPFMKAKGTAKFMDIKAAVSESIGYEATNDMVNTALDRMIDDPNVPITKPKRGLFLYSEQPTVQQTAIGAA